MKSWDLAGPGAARHGAMRLCVRPHEQHCEAWHPECCAKLRPRLPCARRAAAPDTPRGCSELASLASRRVARSTTAPRSLQRRGLVTLHFARSIAGGFSYRLCSARWSLNLLDGARPIGQSTARDGDPGMETER